MGALNSNLVTNYHQGWRLVTAMWLHGGVVHLVCNLLGIAFLLNRLEKEFGLCTCVARCNDAVWCGVVCGGIGRPTAIYLLSGVFAAVFSCLFLNTQISVGASGALFGLVVLSPHDAHHPPHSNQPCHQPYIDNSWFSLCPPSLLPLPPFSPPSAPLLSSLCPPSLLPLPPFSPPSAPLLSSLCPPSLLPLSPYPPMQFSVLMTLIILIAINLAIGLMPYIGIFAHIGGCIAGSFLGFALLLKPQRIFSGILFMALTGSKVVLATMGNMALDARHIPLSHYCLLSLSLPHQLLTHPCLLPPLLPNPNQLLALHGGAIHQGQRAC
ncbi:unnamed protein product [Closterium sp. NIES-65]|nr:unnamed protein product [Closterium sp. NIES-65]